MEKMGYLFQRIAVPEGVHLGGFRRLYEEMKIHMNSKIYVKGRILLRCYYIGVESAQFASLSFLFSVYRC